MKLRIPSKQAAFGASAAACVLAFGGVAEAADCSTLPSPVFAVGSSAVKPFLKGVGAVLAGATSPQTVVYIKVGSCVGVDAVVNGTSQTVDGTIWDATGNETTCTNAAGVKADVGVSDVFATSCAGFESTDLTADGLGDFQGPVQTMVFIVPSASNQKSISAEAGWLTFHEGTAGDTPWNDETLMFRRNSGSGTQSMISKAINVDPTVWKGVDSGSAQGVLTAVSGSATPNPTIGIVSTGESDGARTTVTELAYQAYGQSCGNLPDSSSTSFDKHNVRIGRYAIWGPLHMIAPVTGTTPTKAAAGHLINYVVGTEPLPGATDERAIIDLEITAHVIPQCAMQVSRTAEVGAMASFQPPKMCGCYFDFKADGTAPTGCTSCTTNTDCSGSTPKCNYGYCEAQ